jgi:hypothetical protein
MKKMLLAVVALTLPFAVTLNVPLAVAQTAPSSDALDELASRLLGYGGDNLPELIVGLAPDKRVKLEVPIIDGAKILGTAYRGNAQFETVLDVRGDAKKILGFYRSKFQAKFQDWTDRGPQQGGQSGGFVFSAEQGPNEYVQDTMFCRGEQSFSVAVYRLNAAIKDVRLRGDSYSCSFARGDLELPKLVPPPGAQVRSSSSGFGEEISSSMTFETGLGSQELFAAYAKQLEAAKWRQVESPTLKAGVIGVFEFVDAKQKTWRMLFVVTPASAGQVRASLNVFAV